MSFNAIDSGAVMKELLRLPWKEEEEEEEEDVIVCLLRLAFSSSYGHT
jgi:hypothetical protein